MHARSKSSVLCVGKMLSSPAVEWVYSRASSVNWGYRAGAGRFAGLDARISNYIASTLTR